MNHDVPVTHPAPMLPRLLALRTLLTQKLRWAAWDALLADRGVVLERPRLSRHPRFPEIVYPLDYGYVRGTLGTDGEALDVFVGTGRHGLVGTLVTVDHRRGDTEFKLLYHCTPEEVYTALGFVNYDPALMEGLLVMRRPLPELWG